MTKKTDRETFDIEGRHYSSKVELCKAYGVPVTTFSYRRSRGLSVQSSLAFKRQQKAFHDRRFKIIIRHPEIMMIWEKYNSMC